MAVSQPQEPSTMISEISKVQKNTSEQIEIIEVQMETKSETASIQAESSTSMKALESNTPKIVKTNTQSPKTQNPISFELSETPKAQKPILNSTFEQKKATINSPLHTPTGDSTTQTSPTHNKRNTLPRQRSEREVLVGTPVKEGHVNYMLMYDMLTGIRISVSRCNAKMKRDLAASDYIAAHKLAFDVTGNELTPSSKYDFKFKDYAPWVFRMIREAFHVDAAEYLLSLTGKYVLSELVSSGKSGSFFYYSQDYRFIIKTIHHSEHKFILEILDKYYGHIKNNPHTLLSRIFGLHRVKLPGNRKIHFVVMGNVFPPNKDIHEVYDLKGSSQGRMFPEEEAFNNPRAVLKDLNWIGRNRQLKIGPEKRALFEKQMEIDVQFLSTQNIMDYSLLVGIHDAVRGNTDHIRDQTLSVFEPTAETLSRRATAATRSSKAQVLKDSMQSDVVQLGPSTSKLPDRVPPERRYCIFYTDEGGFRGSNETNSPIKEIYYLGIIDIFTFYSPVKRLETAFKSIGHDKLTISAVHPKFYGLRFLHFMKAAINGSSPNLSTDQDKQVLDILAVPSGSFIGNN